MNAPDRTRPTRRDVLHAAALAPLAARVPSTSRVPVRWLPGADDVTLVVVELEGGNDGLNTLIPIEDARWARARPSLSSVRAGAHRIGDGEFALHPALGRAAARFASGDAAVVHGVGYAPPDRSHFHSRDIWHTADPTLDRTRVATSGWLGRAADRLAAAGAAVPGLALGGLRVPLALRGEQVVVPAIDSLEGYALRVDPIAGPEPKDAIVELVGTGGDAGDLEAFLRDVGREALATERSLTSALAGYRAKVDYPDDDFGRAMQLAARVVVSGFGARLLHVTLSGFDTHANQAPLHAALLAQLDSGLGALLDDLAAHGRLGRTVVFVHSEFGRRVAENRSHGTDHGAAAPVFVFGGGVRPGLVGAPPDLADLDDGDVRPTTDFRRVYADLLGRLGVPVAGVLPGTFEPLGLFAG